MTARLITAQELLQAPTGIDWATLAESGTSNALQTIEQSNLIDRASAWVANYCTQRLDCTTDNELSILGGAYSKAWVDGNGYLWYRTDFFPILSISAMSWGIAGAGSSPTVFNPLNVANLLTFGEFNRVNRVADFSQEWSWLKRGPGLIKITYVNGYPNMVIAGAAIVAGSNVNIQVDSSLGCTATANAIGNTLTIFDGQNTEVVMVTAIPDATHVTVASVANPHAVGVGISAIPADVKEAVILACTHFARQRGVEAFVMEGGNRGPASIGGDALPEAEYLLQPFKRIL